MWRLRRKLPVHRPRRTSRPPLLHRRQRKPRSLLPKRSRHRLRKRPVLRSLRLLRPSAARRQPHRLRSLRKRLPSPRLHRWSRDRSRRRPSRTFPRSRFPRQKCSMRLHRGRRRCPCCFCVGRRHGPSEWLRCVVPVDASSSSMRETLFQERMRKECTFRRSVATVSRWSGVETPSSFPPPVDLNYPFGIADPLLEAALGAA